MRLEQHELYQAEARAALERRLLVPVLALVAGLGAALGLLVLVAARW